MSGVPDRWPELDQADWSETRDALHMWLQIVGKYRLARTPWLNHSWHATFRPTPRGLTTGLIEDDGAAIEIAFDFHEENLELDKGGGGREIVALQPMSVSEFHTSFRNALRSLGADDEFDGLPNEIEDPVAFSADTERRPFDIDAVRRFHRALLSAAAVFEQYRTGFVGKSSPVHLFWGSFDLAVTRFSGRLAPLHPGGIPALPDEVTREAYSHEVASAGFWPGGGPVEEAAFYAYAYPKPSGFEHSTIANPKAFWDEGSGEFILPYEAVRSAKDPEGSLLEFLQDTFEAACDLAGWDRDELVCPIGTPLQPRPLKPRPKDLQKDKGPT